MAIFSTPAPYATPAVGLTQALNCPGGSGFNLAGFKLRTTTDYAHVVVSFAAVINNPNAYADGNTVAGMGVISGSLIYGAIVTAVGNVYHVAATVDIVSGITPTYTLITTSPNLLHHLITVDTLTSAVYPFTVDHTIPVHYTVGLDPIVGPVTPCVLLMTRPGLPLPNIQEIVSGSTLIDTLVTVNEAGEVVDQTVTTQRSYVGSKTYANLWGKHQARAATLADTNPGGIGSLGMNPVNASKVLYRDRINVHQSFQGPFGYWDYRPIDVQGYAHTLAQGDNTGSAWDHMAMVNQGSNLLHSSGSTFYMSEDGYLFYNTDANLSSGDPRLTRQWSFTDLKPYLAAPGAQAFWNPRNGFFSALGDNSDLVVQWNNGIFTLAGVTPTLLLDGTIAADVLGDGIGGGRAGDWYLVFASSGTGDIAHVRNDTLAKDRYISTGEPPGRIGSFANIVYNSGWFVTSRLRWFFPPGPTYPTDLYQELWIWNFSTPNPFIVDPNFVEELPYYPIWMESQGENVMICGGLGGWTSPAESRVMLDDIPFNNGPGVPPYTGPGTYNAHPKRAMGTISFYSPGGDPPVHYSFPNESILRFNRVRALSGSVPGLAAGVYASSVSTGSQLNDDPITSDPAGVLSGEISLINLETLTMTPVIRLDSGQYDPFGILGLDPVTTFPQYHLYQPLDFQEAGSALAISACSGCGVFVYPPLASYNFTSNTAEVVWMGWEFS